MGLNFHKSVISVIRAINCTTNIDQDLVCTAIVKRLQTVVQQVINPFNSRVRSFSVYVLSTKT